MASSPATAPSPKSPPSSSTNSPPPETKASPPPASPPPSPPPPKETAPPPKQTTPPPKEVSPPPKEASPPPPSPPKQSPPPPVAAQPPPTPIVPPPPTVVITTPPPPSSSGSLSPPPPPRERERTHKSPPSAPTHGRSPPPPPKTDSGSNNLPTLIGVIAAVGILAIALFVICMCCFKKKKKKNKPVHYYADASGRKGSQYYDNRQNTNWYSNDPHGHMVPPPPGGMAPPGGGRPQPPPLMVSSNDTSSSFSSPHNAGMPHSPNMALGFNSQSTFSYDELAAATNGFSQANLLGQGGFGYVHRGVLPNGKVIAVKSLKSGSGQGEREFQAEVDIISRVHHRHLVSLVGYCIASGQRMLVYEFVPNKTLEFHLHGKGHLVLDWPRRLTIAVGSAKGLAYLHEDCHPRIIHRDIKTANILLDNNFEAMVADFGLAKLSADNFTHVSTRIMGTFGYLAPEYASSGKLTEKSDVFSFGVMLLEMITGRRPVDTSNTYMEDSLVDWARPLCARALENDDFDELVDPQLGNQYNNNEMKRMIACAASSVRHSAKRRPRMSQIVRALEGDVSLEDLNEGTRATPSSTSTSTVSSEYNTRMYNEDLTKFRKMALADSGLATSTYGLNPSPSSSDLSSNSHEMK